MYAFGSVIDCRMKRASGLLPSACASIAGAVSRFGPVVPLEPAGVNMWHPPHPLEPMKTVLPAATAPLDELVVVADVVVVAAEVVVGVVVVRPTVMVTVVG